MVIAYLALVGLVALERVVELVVSRRHAARSLARGGQEHGRGHYPVMVALHAALLAGCVVEPLALPRAIEPAMFGVMTALVVAAQALRWWCVATLGERWSTRVIVVPGLPRITTGPYRWLRHPNYVAVVLEGLALPLAGSAWITAAAFTALNLALLAVRVRCEERALRAASA